MKNFMRQRVSRYRELCPEPVVLKQVKTPFLNEGLFSEADLLEAGVLSSDASEILMKILYGARVARPDLLRAVCGLASDMPDQSLRQKAV